MKRTVTIKINLRERDYELLKEYNYDFQKNTEVKCEEVAKEIREWIRYYKQHPEEKED